MLCGFKMYEVELFLSSQRVEEWGPVKIDEQVLQFEGVPPKSSWVGNGISKSIR
jgi:hypothetical protein